MDFKHNLKELKKSIDTRVEKFGNQYLVFGIFGAINYPIYWIIWRFFSMQSYENLSIRMIATALCVPLIFTKHWPPALKTWLPIYWYITLTFCLPFFFTFMLFENNASPVWLMSTTAVMFWLILLVDGISFLLILTVGGLLGFVLFYILRGTIPPGDYKGYISQYAGTLLVGLLFARNKENLEKAKLHGTRTIGATIAHELRTPLTAIENGVSGIKDYLPILIDGYTKAKQHHLPVEFIRPHHYEILTTVLDDVESETHYANTIINMILMNVKQNQISSSSFQTIAISACLDEALRRYPFKAKEQELVHWDHENNFLFKGNKVLMVHTLFNLLKNSLYFIEAESKGAVFIRCEATDNYNVLYFKDTAKGIPSKEVSKLFEKFYTTTINGTGLGLAFCKMVMESFGGDISCKSEYGQFVEFILRFPKIIDGEKKK